MNLNANDPRITAYALGELNEREKQEVELDLAKNPALAREVGFIRQMAGVLSEELKNEPATALKPEQRARVAEGRKTAGEWFAAFWAQFKPVGYAVAGVGAVGFLALFTLTPNFQKNQSASPRTQTKPQSSIGMNEKADAPAPALQSEQEMQAGAPVAAMPAKEEKDVASTDDAANSAQPPAGVQLAAPAMKKSLSGATAGVRSDFHARGKGLGSAAEGYGRHNLLPQGFVAPGEPLPGSPGFNTEAYDLIKDNEFKLATQDSLSTFSIDVDTASYSNLRRFLTGGQLPPKDSVRIEELVNYFPYNYAAPTGPDPFAVNVEISQAPWNKEHRLVRIGLKGKVIENSKRPSSNLVFLVDVSGSMQDANKLPWVKQSLKMLVEQLGESDRIAIAVYAGAAGLALQPTRGNDKATIMGAIDRLEAGGSTNGAQGIELAYQTASSGFIKGGTNRVILLTDGDFNVGVTGQGDLARLAEEKSKSGVFLSVLGFGMGNLKDSTMEKIADKGRGHYAYIDSLNEARKVFVEEMGANLVTIAKDVKIQVEFNPAEVNAFRLIGYENRVMQHQEFNDDRKFAGIIGAGHTVTALYEIVPKGKSVNVPGVDALKYQKPAAQVLSASKSGELMTLKLRYKEPEGDASKLLTFPIKDEGRKLDQASKDLRFQASVAGFGMLVRDSPHKGTVTWEEVLDLAQTGRGEDKHGYRAEFIELVKKARDLSSPSRQPQGYSQPWER